MCGGGVTFAKVISAGEPSTRLKLRLKALLLFLFGLYIYIHKILGSSPWIEDQSMHGDASVDATYRPSAVIVRNDQFRSTSMNPVNKLASRSKLPVYTREMAYLAIRPVPWTCGETEEIATDPISNHKPIFAFIHIYKAAGSTIRLFFNKYAAICRKTWMVIIGCTGVKYSSIQSNEKNWNKCRVKEVVDGRRRIHDRESKKKRVYPTVNGTILKENVDIIGGHMRMGTGDSIFGSVVDGVDSATIPPVRHIVFLRDPMSRFVSGILYQINKNGDAAKSMDEIIRLIKKRIRGSRKANEYWGASLSYLLTPNQAEMFINMNAQYIETIHLTPEEQVAEAKARVAIQNLFHYNAIVGMAERMTQSMQILRHALVPDQITSEHREEYLEELFEEYIPENTEVEEDAERSNSDIRMNASEREGVSTASVLAELKNDGGFMPIFEEYIKYEQLITDYAWKMHLLQHETTILTHRTMNKQSSTILNDE